MVCAANARLPPGAYVSHEQMSMGNWMHFTSRAPHFIAMLIFLGQPKVCKCTGAVHDIVLFQSLHVCPKTYQQVHMKQSAPFISLMNSHLVEGSPAHLGAPQACLVGENFRLQSFQMHMLGQATYMTAALIHVSEEACSCCMIYNIIPTLYM